MSKPIKLSAQQHKLAAAIANAETTSSDDLYALQTHSHRGNMNQALRTLLLNGVICQPRLKYWAITAVGQQYLDKPITVKVERPPSLPIVCYPALPRQIDVMKGKLETWMLGQTPYRQGAQDAYAIPSRGIGG